MRFDPTVFTNWAISYLEITGSTVYGPHAAVLVGGEGSVGDETSQDTEAYGAPGVVFRPRPPEAVQTPGGEQRLTAEAMGARTADGLVPFAWRDLRLNRAFPAPKAGTVAFVGYGGGFLSLDDTDADSGDQKATRATLYAPFEFSDGVAAKAHAVILDPEKNAVSVVHADGSAVLLTESGVIMKSPDGTAFIELQDGKIILNAPQVVVRGGMLIGSEAGPVFPLAYISGSPLPSTLLSVSA